MSRSAPAETAGVASLALDKRIEESIAKAIPVTLAKFFNWERCIRLISYFVELHTFSFNFFCSFFLLLLCFFFN